MYAAIAPADTPVTITYVAALGAGATMKAYVEVDAHGDYHRENIFTSIPIFVSFVMIIAFPNGTSV